MFVNLKAKCGIIRQTAQPQFPNQTRHREKGNSKFLVHLSSQRRPFDLGNMSLPNPQNESAFLDHLKTINFDFALSAFLHFQNRPLASPNGRYDEGPTVDWCDRMDFLLVSHLTRYGSARN
jgi:hypothetical protein